MTTIDVIFDHGVFRPVHPVQMPDGTPATVTLTADVSLPEFEAPDAPSDAAPREAKLQLLKQLEELPLEGPADGFAGRDHDQVLYGRRPAE